MNYEKMYNMFIQNRMLRSDRDGYVEEHHIVPRSMGGTDDPDNLIWLTARDHYFAHRLLAKFAGPKMKIALTWFINGANVWKCGRTPPSRVIASIREEANVSRAQALCGREFTDQHRQNLSASKKGVVPWNKGLSQDDPRVAENVRRMTETKRSNPKPSWNKGLSGDDYLTHYVDKPKPPSMTGRVWINNGTQQRKIQSTDVIPDGWSRGRCDNKGDNNPMRKQK